MSLSLFEDFFELPGREDSSASVAESSHDDTDGISEASNEDDIALDSTLGSESTLSFDSSILHDFDSIVTVSAENLAGIANDQNPLNRGNEEFSRSTIVSSAASGDRIPVPQASLDIWAISPHPQLNPGSSDFQALSTVCTDSISYQRYLDGMLSQSPSLDENASRSDSQSIELSPGNQLTASSAQPCHERAVFEAIASQLLGSIPDNKHKTSGIWYSRFTDFDWQRLRDIVKVIKKADGNSRGSALPLPPSPPIGYEAPYASMHQLAEGYNASEQMPSIFVCPHCRDILVGALALDCGCNMCTLCWEDGDSVCSEIVEGEGYDWIKKDRDCSNCTRTVRSTIACPALDVAICQIIEKLDSSRQNSKIQSMKAAYYSRLEGWRQTVLARNEFAAEKEAMEEDHMLARLIEEEEELLWQKGDDQKKVLSNGIFLVLGQVVVALLAGSLSSLAFQNVAGRR